VNRNPFRFECRGLIRAAGIGPQRHLNNCEYESERELGQASRECEGLVSQSERVTWLSGEWTLVLDFLILFLARAGMVVSD
jgi:hypothetical protein